ncbi:MAG: transporter [Gammaproteobacteria bacterium]|nr:transporter [Gammaproteobacteria bacterium]
MCAIGICASAVAGATSDTAVAPQQTLDEAWWTGPLLAPSAATLPQGHWLVEPYVYDLMAYGHFDQNGSLRSTGAAHGIGSQTYIEYGVVDRLTLGLIPRLGLHESSAGQDSSGFTVGDTTLQGAFGLTQFHQGSRVPATSLVIGETFPTGKYDRLGGPTDGALGSGAYSTTVSLYSQTYFWMPNGRILRTRLDLSYSLSQWAAVHGESVYGTSGGFAGRAHPGPSFVGDLAFEYSATQSWVLATDFWWQHDGNTRVEGGYTPAIASAQPSYLVQDSGSDDVLYLAPAVEYNWSATMGVIAGARIAAMGRNVTATVTPVAAVNMVF